MPSSKPPRPTFAIVLPSGITGVQLSVILNKLHSKPAQLELPIGQYSEHLEPATMSFKDIMKEAMLS